MAQALLIEVQEIPGQGSRRREKALFTQYFQTSLRACLKHGFTVEEAFGVIWEESLDQIRLLEVDQGPLYAELIRWARTSAS